MTHAASAASAAPVRAAPGATPMVDALLRVAVAAVSVPARLTVTRACDLDAMTASPSAATAQLGRLSKQALTGGDRLLLADIPRTTDRAANDHDARCFAGWPLIGPDAEPLGVLVATAEQPSAFSEQDLAVLADVALGAAEALTAAVDLAGMTREAEIYRKLIDQSPSIIGRCRLDGTPIFASSATTRILGFDPAELVASGHLVEPHPDDVAALSDDWQLVVDGGEATLRDARVRHHDGTWRTLRISTRPVLDAAGEIEEVRFSARDVTDEVARAGELAATQAEATSRQAMLDAVLETIEVGVVACDNAGEQILSNRVARRMRKVLTGGGPMDWSGWQAYEADGVTPTTLPDRPLALALRGEPVDGVVVAIPNPGGTPSLVRCHARRLADGTGAVAVFADISELAHTSDALREARDRAEAIVATVTDGFISADSHGVVREWNPAAELITGWSADEAIGRRVPDLITPPEERARVAELFTGDTEPDARLIGTITRHVVRKDGTPITAEMTRWTTTHRAETRYNAFLRDVTEARANVAAIAAAHAEFTAALDAMPRAVTLAEVVRDGEGLPTDITARWCNQHLLKLLGRQMAEMAGRSIFELCPWLVTAGLRENHLEVARTGEAFNATVDWTDDERVASAFDLIVTPLGSDTVLIECTDITERVLAKRDLERSERLLSVANHAAGMGSAAFDVRTGQWSWSRQTFEVFGLDPDTDEVPASFRTDIVHPDDVAIYDRQWADIMAGDPKNCEYRIRRPDGQIRHILTWSDVDTDADGNVVNVVLGVQDQTDRREREIALARSRELEGLVVDRSPIGIAFLDEDGRYVQVNGALCHMLGRSRDELLASNFLDITHPDERAAGLRRHRELIQGKVSSFAQDKRYLHANGRVLWVSVHKTVLQSSDRDQPVRVLSQIIDISERQEQTDELTRQAHTDALTGLANRRGWEPRLQAALADSRASGRNLVVAILDLDKFKNFNDTFGHPVGDQLLSETSRAWRAHLIRKAPSSLLARLGGEEFGVLMPNTDVDKARAILETMIRIVARNQTASAGFTLARPDDDPRSLMTRADNALYTAKNTGRARVVSEHR